MVSLGEIAEFRNGVNFVASQRGSGIPVLNVKDFQDRSQPDYTELEQLIPSAVRPESLLHAGDILFVRSNGNKQLIGRSMYVGVEPPCPTTHSAFTIRMRIISPDVEPRYCAYFIRSGIVRQTLSAQGSGTNISNLNQDILSRLQVWLPPRHVQHQIIRLLSAYDDLIDTNLRRVKILREMTQNLFEEWTSEVATDENLANSVPVSEIVTGSLGGDWGEEQPDDDHTEEVRVIRGTDIPDLLTGNFARCPTRYISSQSYRRRMLVPGDIIVENSINAKSRPAGTPLLVTAHVLNALGDRVIAASFCRVFKAKSLLHSIFLLTEMEQLHTSKKIERYQVVAANGIANFQSTRFVSEHAIHVPKDRVRLRNLAHLLIDLHSPVFAVTNSKLRNARDILLPKLISGEIDLSSTKHGADFALDQVAAE
jgi:type I restriction enzyme S subunit